MKKFVVLSSQRYLKMTLGVEELLDNINFMGGCLPDLTEKLMFTSTRTRILKSVCFYLD